MVVQVNMDEWLTYFAERLVTSLRPAHKHCFFLSACCLHIVSDFPDDLTHSVTRCVAVYSFLMVTVSRSRG